MSQAKSSFRDALFLIKATENVSPSRLYSYSVKIAEGAITAPVMMHAAQTAKAKMAEMPSKSKSAISPMPNSAKEGRSDFILNLRFIIQLFIKSIPFVKIKEAALVATASL